MTSNEWIISYSYDPEQYAGASSVPILVIGTKVDLAQVVRDTGYHRSSPIADECGADEIQLVSVQLVSVWLLQCRSSWFSWIWSWVSSWVCYIVCLFYHSCCFHPQDCTQVKHISPGSSNAIRLSRFFDKVHFPHRTPLSCLLQGENPLLIFTQSFQWVLFRLLKGNSTVEKEGTSPLLYKYDQNFLRYCCLSICLWMPYINSHFQNPYGSYQERKRSAFTKSFHTDWTLSSDLLIGSSSHSNDPLHCIRIIIILKNIYQLSCV